jgi:hypothetical protein
MVWWETPRYDDGTNAARMHVRRDYGTDKDVKCVEHGIEIWIWMMSLLIY